ncbi:MAG: hypothetical protein HY952_00395 [Elusimicrobia bacterium]|nr:hypothetical protein [Elusimicrobiota bacterium]
MRYLALSLLLLAPISSGAQENKTAPERRETYRVVVDPSGKGGMDAGVTLVSGLSALTYRGLIELTDSAGMNRRWYLRPLMIPAVVMGLPAPGNFLHEYYGHGAALREYGYEAGTSYEWGWFIGASGKAESMAVQNSGNYEAKQSWVAGGVAATQLYLLEYEKEMYRSGRMTLLAAKPLMAATQDLGYIWTGLDPNADPTRATNDATSWLGYLKTRYVSGNPGVFREYSKKTREAVDRADTLNPAKYWGAVMALHYLWTGDDGFYAPALPVAGLRIGFSPKVNLTPVGPENYYYLFVARRGKLLSLYTRSGESPAGTISGMGAELGPLDILGLALTPGYDKWDLPAAPDLDNCRSGYATHLRLDAPVYGSLGLSGKISYKKKGYLLGQPDGEGYYGYAGMNLTF